TTWLASCLRCLSSLTVVAVETVLAGRPPETEGAAAEGAGVIRLRRCGGRLLAATSAGAGMAPLEEARLPDIFRDALSVSESMALPRARARCGGRAGAWDRSRESAIELGCAGVLRPDASLFVVPEPRPRA